jgi:3-hydroxyacyl-[acyl-carrier protein] dehydratase/trans-2-decenoyl-[acyl-carrier protein] isomerase
MITTENKIKYDFEELISISNGEYFSPGSGILPKPPMLMFDRITLITEQGGKFGNGQVIAELDIKPNLWFFGCHFQDDPVMPGSLGLDGMFQLTGFFLTHLGFKGKGRALGCKTLKFFGEILPNNKLVRYIIDIKRIFNLQMKMIVSDGRIEVDDNTIYTCEDMRVGLIA